MSKFIILFTFILTQLLFANEVTWKKEYTNFVQYNSYDCEVQGKLTEKNKDKFGKVTSHSIRGYLYKCYHNRIYLVSDYSIVKTDVECKCSYDSMFIDGERYVGFKK